MLLRTNFANYVINLKCCKTYPAEYEKFNYIKIYRKMWQIIKIAVQKVLNMSTIQRKILMLIHHDTNV